MGAEASVSIDEVKTHPQFTILGAEKVSEVFGENSSVTLEVSSKVDPYLKYGGAYKGDPKDSKDFHYVIYDELPKVSRLEVKFHLKTRQLIYWFACSLVLNTSHSWRRL